MAVLLGGKRVVDYSLLIGPKGVTVLSAIRTSDIFAQTSYPEGTTKVKFL